MFELARSTAMRSSNLAVALRELDAQGVIERKLDQADKRKIGASPHPFTTYPASRY